MMMNRALNAPILSQIMKIREHIAKFSHFDLAWKRFHIGMEDISHRYGTDSTLLWKIFRNGMEEFW